MEKELYHIYCDESCHLPKDNSNVMILGAIACPREKKKMLYQDIRKIKQKHGIDSKIEIKWTKISQSKIELYKELIDYFFSKQELFFRAVVATNKKKLDHDKFNHGDPNEWYYKMYYQLLCVVHKSNQYRMFIDVKDTNGGARIRELERILRNKLLDHNQEIVLDISQVESGRSDLMQVVDILIGALGYYHRGLYQSNTGSLAKKALVKHILSYEREGFIKGTLRKQHKFNIFIWKPSLQRGEI